ELRSFASETPGSFLKLCMDRANRSANRNVAPSLSGWRTDGRTVVDPLAQGADLSLHHDHAAGEIFDHERQGLELHVPAERLPALEERLELVPGELDRGRADLDAGEGPPGVRVIVGFQDEPFGPAVR